MKTDRIDRLRRVLWWIIGLSLLIHLVSLILGHTIFAGWRWTHLPVHAAAEMSGSVVALIVAWFLYSLHRRGEGTSYNLVIACALIAMGILDGMHALEKAGKVFVWLHSTATFAGGAFFVLIWLPRRFQERLNGRWLFAVFVLSVVFGAASMALRDWVPAMIAFSVENGVVGEGRFTFPAKALNVGGGFLMLAAAIRLFLTYQRERNVDDLLFCLHSTLFGAAAIMFEQSVLWDLPWWGWHLLRLLAYLVALWFILLTDLRAQRKLRETRDELKELNASLEERVVERTQTLERREAESRTIIESSPNGMIMIDEEGRIERLNRAAAGLFGYDREELLGQSIELLVPGVDRSGQGRLRENLVSNPEPQGMEAERDLSGRSKDGTAIPLEIGLNPIETAEGFHVLATIVDLRERVRAEEELKLISNRLIVATKAGAIGIWDYDVVNNALVWDDHMYRLYGISPDQFPGAYEAWEEGLHPEDRAGEAEKLQRALQGNEEFDTEFRVIWPDDGSVHFIKANGTVLRDESGEAVRMIGTNRDITARKRYESELRQAMQRAEAAARAKSEFLANMSHEIRTPMNGIMGMTELLQGTSLEKSQREYVALINQSAESLLTIINDILDFSKIEAGKLHLDAHEFDLRDSVGDTLQTLGFRAGEKGLELAYQVAPDVPDCLVGDVGRIRQILFNLVGNALKFTGEGEVVVDVRLESQAGDQVSLHFLVKDTGIGISPEKQGDIFESFTQAESSTTRTFGGTGLGLTISKRLVELMHGRIWVESEPGQGSTFQFTVQLGLGSGSPPPAPETLFGLSVLVVDDNATNRRILEEMLSNWEMAPRSAASGAEALETLAAATKESAEPFQLILLDMMMPDMDGLEVARRIRDQHGDTAPGILMLTSAGQTLSPEEISELGIERVLAKPVKQFDLLDAITRLLGTSIGDEKGDHTAPATRPVEIPPMKVLLAEDGRVNQMVAIKLLEDRGHSVVLAEDGQAAVEKHEGESFDAILMDVQMPRLDGYGATGKIRERERSTGDRIPIIAMTANAMKGDREKCLEAGMDDYVAKPVRSQELFSVLEKYGATDGIAAPESEQ